MLANFVTDLVTEHVTGVVIGVCGRGDSWVVQLDCKTSLQ